MTDKYEQALQMVSSVRDDIDNLIEENNLDGLIGLTRNPAWEIDLREEMEPPCQIK